jgi:hypothetical protein
MEALTTWEMQAIRGGGNSTGVTSIGNIALAVPIDLVLVFGSGDTTNISQSAGAAAGNQFLNFGFGNPFSFLSGHK